MSATRAGRAPRGLTPEGDWPFTSRSLPWAVAALLTTVMVVPIDAITLPIPLPFDARPDRVLLGACFLLWFLVILVRPLDVEAGPRHRYGIIDLLVVAFPVVALASIALNLPTLQVLGEALPAAKRLVLLVSYVAFFIFVVGTVRPSEVPAYVRLVVGLGSIAGLATVIEYFTEYNLLYEIVGAIAPPGVAVESAGGLVTPTGRPDVTGPARHGLAVCTMLAMVLPLAVVGGVTSPARRERLVFRIAALIILVGCLATVRRSGVILPFVATSAVVAFGGRRMIPVALAFALFLLATPLVVPGAAAQLAAQFSTSNVSAQRSVSGRTADYSQVGPDIRSHALFGRGFGSYDATRYRFLDNQYLGLLIGVGTVGVAIYVSLIMVPGLRGLRWGLRGKGQSRWLGLALFGSSLAFLLANALFDTLAFPQAPYVFLLLSGLFAVATQTAPHAPG